MSLETMGNDAGPDILWVGEPSPRHLGPAVHFDSDRSDADSGSESLHSCERPRRGTGLVYKSGFRRRLIWPSHLGREAKAAR